VIKNTTSQKRVVNTDGVDDVDDVFRPVYHSLDVVTQRLVLRMRTDTDTSITNMTQLSIMTYS